ncbi:MAG TPA: ABC transporter permease [Burkholderiales bacterium]|jgi:microcin C transport system permease protein|nr:ABC transporter permease [Burkholderiales bacterium]
MASILAGSGATPNAPSVPVHASPGRRAWRRFRANRLGYVSLLVFAFFFAVSLLAEVLSNDRPLVVRYNGNWYFPVLQTLPETTFGGDFPTPTDYLDPDIRANLAKPSNLVVYPPNRYHARTINYFAKSPDPARPSAQNRLGTDAQGRDLLARLLYGFRLSVLFGLIVAAASTAFGILFGAVQGYLAGWSDIAMERFKEIWGSMPMLYMLIIFSSLFSPSFWLLVVLIAIFGWLGIAAYVRAEFLKNRTLDYVRAARALGQSNRTIMWRHILPNSLTPVVTLVPFEIAAAIGALTSLDFLGLGVPPGTPSLGELLQEGKDNLDAWWISLSTFTVLVLTLLLLIMIGDALRDALDPRKVLEGEDK